MAFLTLVQEEFIFQNIFSFWELKEIFDYRTLSKSFNLFYQKQKEHICKNPSLLKSKLIKHHVFLEKVYRDLQYIRRFDMSHRCLPAKKLYTFVTQYQDHINYCRFWSIQIKKPKILDDKEFFYFMIYDPEISTDPTNKVLFSIFNWKKRVHIKRNMGIL